MSHRLLRPGRPYPELVSDEPEVRTCRRVLVYGSPGSGKTHAAGRIAARIGSPAISVDDLIWNPGWRPIPDEDQRRTFAAVLADESWVLDGATHAFRDLVVQRADLIVALDYPRWRSLARLLRRSAGNVRHQRVICNGNVETVGDLLGRDSILLWHFQSFRRIRQRMRGWALDPEAPRVLLFSRPRELEAWIASLDAVRGP
jgi:adenylate kinase family enzyme